MSCPAPALAALLASLAGFQADGGISAAKVEDLKNATAFIKFDSAELTKTGSGFLVRVDDRAAYVVTNEHVIAATVSREITFTARRGSRTMTGQRRVSVAATDPRITVVLRSGTRQ